MEVRIESSWKEALSDEFDKPYFTSLVESVKNAYAKEVVYPAAQNIFRAFDLCPFDQVKVVIIGQDPYHGERQAMGLSFSVPEGVVLPPSLQNILKEVKNDLEVLPFKDGDLTRWAKQGVLLLNSVLTVTAHQPASHKNLGWEQFTDAVIQVLSKREHIVYLLWGNFAKQKAAHVDPENNSILTSGHPSPLSVTRFRGNKHFSQTNAYLQKHGLEPIDWR